MKKSPKSPTVRVKKVNDWRYPIDVNEDVWFYRDKNTFDFVVWTKGKPGVRQVANFRIRHSLLKKNFTKPGASKRPRTH